MRNRDKAKLMIFEKKFFEEVDSFFYYFAVVVVVVVDKCCQEHEQAQKSPRRCLPTVGEGEIWWLKKEV